MKLLSIFSVSHAYVWQGKIFNEWGSWKLPSHQSINTFGVFKTRFFHSPWMSSSNKQAGIVICKSNSFVVSSYLGHVKNVPTNKSYICPVLLIKKDFSAGRWLHAAGPMGASHQNWTIWRQSCIKMSSLLVLANLQTCYIFNRVSSKCIYIL